MGYGKVGTAVRASGLSGNQTFVFGSQFRSGEPTNFIGRILSLFYAERGGPPYAAYTLLNKTKKTQSLFIILPKHR